MEREDEIERREWSLCCICEGDYREDIRINAECLHSYCYECIVQTSSTSTLCPICETPLPTPLSSLPQNHVLLTWRSLSPPSPFSLTSIDNFYKKDLGKNEEKNFNCEGCGEKTAKLKCIDCSRSYCKECFEHVHSLKVLQKHKTTPLEISSPINNFAKNTPQNIKIKTILDYEECDKNNHKKMKEVYCKNCDQFICLYCMDEDHNDHQLLSVLKYVEKIKGKWESFRENVEKNIKSKFDVNTNMKLVNDHLLNTNQEIERLEEELRKLYLQKNKYEKIISLNLHVEKEIDISLRFIRHFITTLPLLPLSSYYPFFNYNINNDLKNNNININQINEDHNNSNSNNDNNNDNIINEEEVKMETVKRMKIKQMMEEDYLEKVFSSIDPSLSTPSLFFQFNLLEVGKNEISTFKPPSFPRFITLLFSSDLLIISDYSNTKLYKLNGSIYEGNPIKRNYSLILGCTDNYSHIYLPKKNLIYLSRNYSEKISLTNFRRNLIEIYTFNDQKLMFKIAGNNNSNNIINKEFSFGEIKGMGKSVKLDLLFVCDYSNKRILIFKLSSGEFHSKIELDFQPTSIDHSKSANLLVISNSNQHIIYLFSLFPPHNNTENIDTNENNDNIIDIKDKDKDNDINNDNIIDIKDKEDKTDENKIEKEETNQEIKPTLLRKIEIEKEFEGRINDGQTVAIHSKQKYFVVVTVDKLNLKLIFFNFEGDFITSFQPTNKQLQNANAISIDKKENIFAISCNGQIYFIRAPHSLSVH